MAFDTVLVANRGEIAVRVMRTLREMGLRGVAVYSRADAGAPHVAAADMAICIGDGPAQESYLCPGQILAAARESGAGAIHPGYGFLSENAGFAEAVEEAGLVFIGPPAQAIRSMGNKAAARRLMAAAGIPCVPGYDGADQSDAAFAAEAGRIGYPVMVKAAAGGGGRGMRLVRAVEELPEALAQARSEAAEAFGSDELVLERAVENARHVEFQVFADAFGNVVHLGERDCSVQRRHQKVIEEAPCPVMTPDLRDRMGQVAVEAARAVGYRGAGTVEFLLDESGGFHFLEMNTRLQVEHPVTEMVTGLDLVAMQIRVARGEALGIAQEDLRLAGHAIEARLYAEDAANGFLPATGRIELWRPAKGDGIRIDSGIASGFEVTSFYDPLLAKIVAHGATREEARARLLRAVRDSVVLGCVTNAPFLAEALARPEFAAGQATTGFLDRAFPRGFSPAGPDVRDFALAAALLMRAGQRAAMARAGFIARDQLGWSSAPLLPRDLALEAGGATVHLRIGARPGGWHVQAGGEEFGIAMDEGGEDGPLTVRIDGCAFEAVARVSGGRVHLALGGRRTTFRRLRAGAADGAEGAGGLIRAPMPGLVREIAVRPGQAVEKGDTLAILEAMKMQHRIVAVVSGTVTRLCVEAGQQVAAGTVLAELEEN